MGGCTLTAVSMSCFPLSQSFTTTMATGPSLSGKRLVLPASVTVVIVPPLSPIQKKMMKGTTAYIRTISSQSIVIGSSTSLRSSCQNCAQLVPIPCDDGQRSNDDESENGKRSVSGISSSPQLVRREYAQLNLKQDWSSGHVRIRQHVNPLSSSLSVPARVPEWNEVFHDPTLPLMVDIGCGGGRFLLWLANKSPTQITILVWKYEKGWSHEQSYGQRSLTSETCKSPLHPSLFMSTRTVIQKELFYTSYFMFANATNSFEPLVASYPGPVMLVSLLCPDPCFKNRHRKRRTLQKPLLDSISKNLFPGGKVFVQSDIYDVAVEMREQFDALSDVFEHAHAVDHKIICDSGGWVLSNPMGIRTEREIHAEFEGAKIYRRLYIKRGPLLPAS